MNYIQGQERNISLLSVAKNGKNFEIANEIRSLSVAEVSLTISTCFISLCHEQALVKFRACLIKLKKTLKIA